MRSFREQVILKEYRVIIIAGDAVGIGHRAG
jgi:hypothetical protein